MWELLVLRSFARAAAADDRPVMLSVACILGFYTGFANIWSPLVSLFLVNTGYWLVAFVFFYGGFTLICMVALWRMRRWAIIAFALLFAVNQLVLYLAGIWPRPEILFSSTIIVVGFHYYRDLE